MSYPEGGSECPPEESPVPGSPSSMATSSDGTVLGHTRPADDGSSSSSSSANQSNKGKVVPNQQKSKIRNLKPLPLPDAKPNDPSSEETANMNNNSIDKDNQCTKCTRSLAGNVKVEDLKKPSKVNKQFFTKKVYLKYSKIGLSVEEAHDIWHKRKGSKFCRSQNKL